MFSYPCRYGAYLLDSTGGVEAIEVTDYRARVGARFGSTRLRAAARIFGAFAAACAVVAGCLMAATSAEAASATGRAGTGDLLFYPCSTCHPTGGPAAERKLPNGFEKHQIVLGAHRVLGTDETGCLVCHESPEKDPGQLKTLTGTVSITGDVSRVCYTCHANMYNEWKAHIHGKREAKCTASGCHDPHTPSAMFGKALLPFVGNGFEFRVLPQNSLFMPLATPGNPPPVETPSWLIWASLVGVVSAGGLLTSLIRGRSKR
jgi:hypothetical protein